MARQTPGKPERFPWLLPLLSLAAAAVLVVAVGYLASLLSPQVVAPPTPQPATTPVSAEIIPPGYTPPVPINYIFYDWSNVDYGALYPDAGPVGSLLVVPWRRIHVDDNVFDWRYIDNYLTAAQTMTVRLDDGSVITKPVIIEIVDNESVVPSSEIIAPYPALTRDSAFFLFADLTPGFVRNRIRTPISPITWVTTLTPTRQVAQLSDDRGSYLSIVRPGDGACQSTVVAFVPKYGHPEWLRFYKQMVYALGARYNNDPRVGAVLFGPGIDAEFGQPTKPYFECDLRSAFFNRSPLGESDYLSLVVKAGPLNDIADWYRDAFPSKPLYLQFTGAGKTVIDRLHAENHVPPIGLKQATLVHDNLNQWQDDGAGTLQLMMRYSTTHPIAWENAVAWAGPEPRNMQIRYFTLLAGLTAFPDWMDFIGGWPVDRDTLATGMFSFQRRYLGRTITTTDEIWVAMRDTDFWPPIGGAIKYAGWRGDFTYGLSRLDGIPGNATRIITSTGLTSPPFNLTFPITRSLYSLIARRTDIEAGSPYMSFSADRRWQFWGQTPRSVSPTGVWYDVTLKYVDLGTDSLAIEYMDHGGITRTKSIRKRDTGQWVTSTVAIDDAYLRGQFAGGADFRLSAEPERGGVDEIVHMVMVKGYRGGDPTPTATPARPTRTPLPLYEQLVNCGGPAYVDSQGARWDADRGYSAGSWGYVGGNAYTAVGEVTGSNDPALYKTERWWPAAGSYLFDVPNGRYEVELRFAETLRNGRNLRLFDVAIEGRVVLENLDLFAQAGFNRAFDRVFTTVVTDGQLRIDVATRRDSAKINAIRVTYAPPATATATPTPRTTPAATPTPTRLVSPTPVPTPTVSPLERDLSALEERYRHLNDLVEYLLRLLPQIGR